VVSDEFGPLARAEAEVLGLGALPLIAIPHPLAGNDTQLVAAKAAAISGAVCAALVASREVLERAAANQFAQLTERRLAGGQLCVDTSCTLEPALDPTRHA
jgi:hypothetical protein